MPLRNIIHRFHPVHQWPRSVKCHGRLQCLTRHMMMMVVTRVEAQPPMDGFFFIVILKSRRQRSQDTPTNVQALQAGSTRYWCWLSRIRAPKPHIGTVLSWYQIDKAHGGFLILGWASATIFLSLIICFCLTSKASLLCKNMYVPYVGATWTT